MQIYATQFSNVYKSLEWVHQCSANGKRLFQFLNIFKENFYFICTCLSIRLSITDVQDPGGQKASGPLELDLWTVMSCHVSAGNRAQVLCKCSKCYSLLSHLSSPLYLHFYC